MFTARALMTDLYQLTMAQGYLLGGLSDRLASFYVHFRENPYNGGYAIAAGIAQIEDLVANYRFSKSDCEYLAGLKTPAGGKLFKTEFIDYLRELKLSLDMDAVLEGTVVFPNEPVLCTTGSIIQCQLVETAILNLFNFQTLIATKAARVCDAAKGAPVAEFGLRRAQGPAGGLLASRAAFIGGCSSTSNVEAAAMFDLPVSGTHAHSWVMAHDSELESFRAFAQVFPHNSTLLVDTYDVTTGVKNAIIVAKEMEAKGERLSGIRIDSGDLVWLSVKARELLDKAGCDYVKIVASNDLDEYTIASLREQGAKIDMWGVGTRLATAWEQPALSGVYKLCAVKDADADAWTGQLKISEQTIKTTLPGLLAARRYYNDEGIMVGDMIYDRQLPPTDDWIIDPRDELRRKDLNGNCSKPLLLPLIRDGHLVSEPSSVTSAQLKAKSDLASLHPANRRFLNPHSYPVGLERKLCEQRDIMIRSARAIET